VFAIEYVFLFAFHNEDIAKRDKHVRFRTRALVVERTLFWSMNFVGVENE
jgi:hypothetical protein